VIAYNSSSCLPSLVFHAALALCLLPLGCADAAAGEAGTGGGGSGGAPARECDNDQDCLDLFDFVDGAACDAAGQCYVCEHADPSVLFETPEFWDPTQFEPGAELGLNAQFAYWSFSADGLGAPSACFPSIVENGEVIGMGAETDCEPFFDEDVDYRGDLVFVPIAPAAWLSSGPSNGLYYNYIDLGELPPTYFCESGPGHD